MLPKYRGAKLVHFRFCEIGLRIIFLFFLLYKIYKIKSCIQDNVLLIVIMCKKKN